MVMAEASHIREVSFYVFGFRYPRRGMTNKLFLDVSQFDFLCDDEAVNTKSTLTIEYQKSRALPYG